MGNRNGSGGEYYEGLVASIIPKDMRSTGFGVFETLFGIFWFLGSWILGVLYDRNIQIMALVSFLSQVGAIILFFVTLKAKKKE